MSKLDIIREQGERIAALETKLEAMEREAEMTWGMCALLPLLGEIEQHFGRFSVGSAEAAHHATIGSLTHQLRRLQAVAKLAIAAAQEEPEEPHTSPDQRGFAIAAAFEEHNLDREQE